jgi:hypothetical protein
MRYNNHREVFGMNTSEEETEKEQVIVWRGLKRAKS